MGHILETGSHNSVYHVLLWTSGHGSLLRAQWALANSANPALQSVHCCFITVKKNLCGSVPAESCKEMACWHHCTGVINSLHKLQLYCLALYFQGLVNPPCHHLMSCRAVITGLMNTLHTGFHWRNKIPIMAPNLPFFFRHSHLVRHVLLRKPSLFFYDHAFVQCTSAFSQAPVAPIWIYLLSIRNQSG